MRFSYVEFKDAKHCRIHGGRGINKSIKSATDTNMVTDADWDLEQSGALLLMRWKATGETYAAPLADMRLSLVVVEEKPAAKKASQ